MKIFMTAFACCIASTSAMAPAEIATVSDGQYLVPHIKRLMPKINEQEAVRYSRAILRSSKKWKVDPFLILSVIRVESAFNHKAVSPTNDFGPMQVNGWWFNRRGITKEKVRTIDGGVDTGVMILSLIRDEKKNEICWWSAYNAKSPDKRKQYELRIKQEMGKVVRGISCASVNKRPLMQVSLN